MLRFKSHNTPRISNSLAVFAALMLMVSTLAGFSDAVLTATNPVDQTAGIETAQTQTFASDTAGRNANKNNKSFKASLFLFRFD